MGSDRARVSYDPNQLYRSVVMQQGRVTLEADWNEAEEIAAEELRSEALDFVGPAGTPDDGYKVTPAQGGNALPFDYFIKAGTMYVGGMRAYLPHPVRYSNQPDWLDFIGDPDWVDLSTIAQNPPNFEFVYLFLREQEVSAVEDPDLKDIALGGPDTAQRTRLLQRFPRVVSPAGDCASGLAAAEAKWDAEGLVFDPATMRLNSRASLLVGFSDQTSTSNCEPQAQGGYLGPDNQLIRVQISGRDSLTGRPKVLWGFDDASFLYRIDVDPNNPQTLILQSPPVDNFRQPVAGQAVEILRSAAELPNGAFVASLSGFVVTLDQNYRPDTQSVTLPNTVSLPAEFLAGNQSPPAALYLRVWQQEKIVTPGTETALGDTGLLITIRTDFSKPFHLGDYWLFAVRPATPQTVYPERYQNGFQPPDGPRLWACALGVIEWSRKGGILVADCRNPFDNLVELTKRRQGCCTFTVRPEDITGSKTLQSIVDKAGSPTLSLIAADAGSAGNNISISIFNVRRDVTPATFEMTVTETDVYPAINIAQLQNLLGTGGTTGSKPGLAHLLAGSLKGSPQNQTVRLTGGTATAAAQGNLTDSRNNVALTLQAKKPGVDGNRITATISNSTGGSPSTFDLTLIWTRTLTNLTVGNLLARVQADLAYEFSASTTGFAPSVPAEGVTVLTGGADAANTPAGSIGAIKARGTIYGNAAKICLRAGTYRLTEPLVFGPRQGNLTIEACGGDVVIEVGPNANTKIDLGMFQLVNTGRITLHGLTFTMSARSFFGGGNSLGNLPQTSLLSLGESSISRIVVSIAIRLFGCESVTVEECTFRYPLIPGGGGALYAGILANANCSDITIERNNFVGPANIVAQGDAAATLVFGYIQGSSLSFGTSNAIERLGAGLLVSSITDRLSIRDNRFTRLIFAVLLDARLGQFRFTANRISACSRGLTIGSLLGLASATKGQIALPDKTAQGFAFKVLSDATFQNALTIPATIPAPEAFVSTEAIPLPAAPPAAPAPPLTGASGGIQIGRAHV